MRKKRTHPTLLDVAREAGVGTTTVSRVINGGHRVSLQTLERVRAVIERLGYHPNQAARILKGERTKTIGLIVPSIADVFYSSCAEAVQKVARSHDSLMIMAASGNDPRLEMEHLNVLIRHRTDGILLAPADFRSQDLATLLRLLPIPLVSFDRPIRGVEIPSVLINNREAARGAVQHLIDHGRRRILCLGGEPALYTIIERIRGYREAIEGAGLLCLVDTSVIDFKTAESAVKIHLSSPNPPDAIFTLKNLVTMCTFEALQKLNVRIPESMALLGFDDFELAATLRPAISVVQQPIEDLGRTAAELLFDRLVDGKNREKRGRTTLETRLILRSSCGCSPGAEITGS